MSEGHELRRGYAGCTEIVTLETPRNNMLQSSRSTNDEGREQEERWLDMICIRVYPSRAVPLLG